MSQRFLVATDLSHRGDRAVARAFELAARHHAALTLLHVTDDALPEDLAETVRTDARARLARFASTRNSAAEVAHECHAILGDPAAGIVAEAERAEADLLILGLHRTRPFLDSVRETTMERVVRHCARPALLVRDAVDHAYAHILAAVDFTPASTTALTLAARLAPGARIDAVHAVHIPYRGFTAPVGQATTAAPFLNAARAEYAAWRAASDLPEGLGEVDIVEGPVESTILRRAAGTTPDLLCLGAHGRAGAARAILGSVANELMRAPPCDLLIAR